MTIRLPFAPVIGAMFAVVSVAACSSEEVVGYDPPPLWESADASEPDFGGATNGSAMPAELPIEEQEAAVDAGPFEVDKRCCNVVFSISDTEPEDATGRVRGRFGPIEGEGVALVREDGLWSASACMPLGSSTLYWYEFTFAEADGGTTVVQRASSEQPLGDDGDYPVNLYPWSDEDCTDIGELP